MARREGVKIATISFFSSLMGALAGVALFYLFILPHLEKVEIPDLTGKTMEEARSLLESRGLKFYLQEERHDLNAKEGEIISQSPPGRFWTKRNKEVRVIISKGMEAVTLPELTGLKLEDATRMLQELGLRFGGVVEGASDSIPKGLVISSTPPGGSTIERGSSVGLTVSGGAKGLVVPSLIGLRLSRVLSILKEKGLILGKVKCMRSREYDPGVVIKQSPSAGSPIGQGEAVDLWVAKEEEE